MNDMTSERKIEANRSNAKRSTGPKTGAGKARSSRNAHQHGLSRLKLEANIGSDGLASALTPVLMQQRCPSVENDLARANLWLARIREVRFGMLAALMEYPSPKQMKRLAGLERYERPVRAAQRRALKRYPKAE